jgi:UPF0755 protein
MQAMDQQLADSMGLARDPDLPLQTEEEALILASIIEKETGQSGERAEIAGVFVRRLRIGMRLADRPDRHLRRGQRRFDGNLTRAHLQADTPWNTYTRAGSTADTDRHAGSRCAYGGGASSSPANLCISWRAVTAVMCSRTR